MACDARKGCYALCEEQGLVIWRHSPAPRVDLLWAKDVDQPSNKVLHHTLKHLMKDILLRLTAYSRSSEAYAWQGQGV